MKQVTLYTATKKLVPYTTRGCIPYVIRDRLQVSINSDHVFDTADTTTVSGSASEPLNQKSGRDNV